MLDFKTNGLYIFKHDLNIEGYFTHGIDGKAINHKYGFFNKLSDILRYGRTLNIIHYYIYFYNPSKKAEIKLRIGSAIDDLTDLLLSLKKRSHWNDNDFHNYEVEDSSRISVKMKNKNPGLIYTINKGNSLIYSNHLLTREYIFIRFPI